MTIRKLAATAAIALSLAAPAIAADTTLWANVGNWQVRVDNTLGNACYMAAIYGKTVLRIGLNNIDNSGYLSISNDAWKSLVPGQKYDVGLQIDDNQVKTYHAIAQTGTTGNIMLALWFTDPQNFMSSFGLSNSVRLFYGSSQVANLGLAGSTKAIKEMEQCNEAFTAHSTQPTDPFQHSAPATPAKAYDPFERNT